MNTSPLASSKLHGLLTQLWNSPVFGDSYPSSINHTPAWVLRTIDEVYHQSIATLDHVLALAEPELCPSERDLLIRQVAAKSVAFCGAIGAGEIDDAEYLRAAASVIALVSWTDQTMDRGNDAMVTAVELVAGVRECAFQAQTAATQHYVIALGWFQREVAIIARPEDRPWVLRCLIDDTLAREARMRRLSERYQRMDSDSFWERFADEIGHLAVHDVGFVAVTAMVYAIYRQRHPELPCLLEILNEPAIMDGPIRAGEATIRMLDDIGDQVIDSGKDQTWGVFTINLRNQDDPRHVNAFLDAAGIADPTIRTTLRTARVLQDDAELIDLWLDYVRSVYAAIPEHLQRRYATFLQLSQRVVEAGLVNALGDDVLAEEPRERAVGA